MNNQSIDQTDLKNILLAILKQALDDYIKLQPPSKRRKKHLQEAWLDAIDMLFDDSYRMLHVQNELGEDMSLYDLLSTILESSLIDIEKLRDHAIDEALQFWNSKYVPVIEIPETIQIDGHVYHLVQQPDAACEIDFNKKLITLNSNLSDSMKEETLITLVFDIICQHEDLPMPLRTRKTLGKAWYRMLKLNSCFLASD